jgi:hypothetical protein
VPLIPEVIVPLFMMLTSLKKKSDGRPKNKHNGIKAINTIKKKGGVVIAYSAETVGFHEK